MLFLYDSGQMFIVEYKLNGLESLQKQIYRNDYTIGIINQNIKKGSQTGGRIFQYTGMNNDYELETIHNFLIGRYGDFGSNYQKNYSNGNEAVYYWGYRNTESSLQGGIKFGKRLSYYELYKQAIVNLQKHYNWKLDFYLVYSVLGHYARSTAKKHYDNVIEQKGAINGFRS